MARSCSWHILFAVFFSLLCASRGGDLPSTCAPIRLSDRYRLPSVDGSAWIDFALTNGAVLALQSRGQQLSAGSRNGCLWGMVTANNSYVGGCGYPGGAPSFTAQNSTCSVSIVFASSSTSGCVPNVTIGVRAVQSASSAPSAALFAADMAISMPSTCQQPYTNVLWLSDMVIEPQATDNVVLPVLPGLSLTQRYFTQRTPRSYSATYPGQSVFADLFSLRTINGGSWAYISARNATSPVAPAVFALVGNSPSDWFIHHSYQVFLTGGMQHSTPTLMLALGDFDLTDLSILYSSFSGAADYPPLRSKLGPRFDAFASSPLVKVDSVAMGTNFSLYPNLTQQYLSRPALIHICAYEPIGFDRYYPDMLPPNPKFGTTDDLAAAVQTMQQQGHLVMPYANPTWWDVQSPTIQSWLQQNISMTQFCLLNSTGRPRWETYGPNSGVVSEPHSPLVQSRLDLLLTNLSQTVPFDAIFEDQIGARPWLLDYSSLDPSHVAYETGWINHTTTAANRGLLLMTEQGFDALAMSEVSFCGSYLQNQIDGQLQSLFGVGTWHFVPLAAMAFRHSVLLNPHNLAGETFTTSLQVLTFSMAMGYQLAHEFDWVVYNNPTLAPWIQPVLALQHLIVANYIDQRATSYTTLQTSERNGLPTITATAFDDGTIVTASWDAEDGAGPPPIPLNGHVVAPGGYFYQDRPGDLTQAVTSGAYTTYNGWPLNATSPFHIIIENRTQLANALHNYGSVQLWHPYGSDTDVAISIVGSCATASNFLVSALDVGANNIRNVSCQKDSAQPLVHFLAAANTTVGNKAVPVDSYLLWWEC